MTDPDVEDVPSGEAKPPPDKPELAQKEMIDAPAETVSPRRHPFFRHFVLLISSGLYTGYIPVASGTFATALAIVFYWPFAGLNRLPSQGGSPWLYAGVILLVCILGTWTSGYAEKVYNEKDPHRVVIDEIAGYFISMFLLPFTWFWLIAAFFVFRFFDVWKPSPIRELQFLKGGYGIMVDDLLAGLYTCIILHLINYFIGGTV